MTNLKMLAATVERHTREDGEYETAIPGLWLYRSSAPSEEHAVVYVTSLCVVAQGAKGVSVGGQVFRYDPAQSLLVSVDMPALTHVAEATAERPCLAIRIPIDPTVVSEFLAVPWMRRCGLPVKLIDNSICEERRWHHWISGMTVV